MSEGTPADSKGARTQRYVPAVGPRLKKLLYVVLGLFALLFINGAYLVGITVAEWSTGETITVPGATTTEARAAGGVGDRVLRTGRHHDGAPMCSHVVD